VLQAANVGLDDNFFDIGGTSMQLIRVRAELQKQLDRQIPVTWMFEFTSVRALADKLRDGDDKTASAAMGAAQDQARKQRDAFARMRAMKGGRA
jgi:acyl carrier protein